MTKTPASFLSLLWAIAVTSALLIGIGILLGLLAAMTAAEGLAPLFQELVLAISGLVYAALGALVLSRYPRHPIGWILAGMGLITALEVLDVGYLSYAIQRLPRELSAVPDVAEWLLFWVHVPRLLVPITMLVLLFPDGQLPSRRWRPVGWAAAIALSLTMISFAFSSEPSDRIGVSIENPFAVESQFATVGQAIGGVLAIIALVGALASVFIRFRRSTGIGRQQVKWLAYSMGVMLLSLVAAAVLSAASVEGGFAQGMFAAFQGLAAISIPAAASIAVLRYRLYSIDIIINRTLVYGGLSVGVVGLYVIVVGALGALFQAQGSLLISLLATGLVAILFHPMRDRLQLAVNRLLYGQRDEPYDVLSRLGQRLESHVAPEAMLSSIVETVAETLKLPYVAIMLPDGGEHRTAARVGQLAGEPIAIPLQYRGVNVGQLLCAPRGPGETFTAQEERLLRDIANQAAVTVHALSLSAALQSSRERLVTAREEERRRLRRDLHDGLGPQLASLALKLDAAHNQMKVDPDLAEAVLLQLRWDVQDAISDIRRLVYNLRPPVLDELGLIPALRASAAAQLTESGPRVVVEGPESLPALPAAVEVAAYRIAQEAVTNVVRHAHAHRCIVRLELADGLVLEVLDDGNGLPESYEPGVGLNSMRERTAELGGSFMIERLPEGGARVLARFPLSPQEQ